MVNPSSFQIRAKKLGVLIQNARVEIGKSADDCANAIGVSTAEYQTYEQGKKMISLPELEALAYYIDVPVDHFLGREMISF